MDDQATSVFIFQTRSEAQQVYARLQAEIELNGVVTVDILKTLLGQESTHIESHVGWTNINAFKMQLDAQGRLRLIIPSPSHIV